MQGHEIEMIIMRKFKAYMLNSEPIQCCSHVLKCPKLPPPLIVGLI